MQIMDIIYRDYLRGTMEISSALSTVPEYNGEYGVYSIKGTKEPANQRTRESTRE